MTEEMDAMEIIGRSFRVPDEGIVFKANNKNIKFEPVKTNDRIFNYTQNGSFYILATPFGTFILPMILGVEHTLEECGFKKVTNEILPIELDSNYVPFGTRNQAKWYHMLAVIGKYNASIAHELLANAGKDKFKILDFFDSATIIPFSGIYDSEASTSFYPMASMKFPYIDFWKLGKFNSESFDDSDDSGITIIYAGNGNTYLINTKKLSMPLSELIACLKASGYSHEKSLYIPKP